MSRLIQDPNNDTFKAALSRVKEKESAKEKRTNALRELYYNSSEMKTLIARAHEQMIAMFNDKTDIYIITPTSIPKCYSPKCHLDGNAICDAIIDMIFSGDTKWSELFQAAKVMHPVLWDDLQAPNIEITMREDLGKTLTQKKKAYNKL